MALQNPNVVTVSGTYVGPEKALRTTRGGSSSTLNVNGAAVLIKAGVGRVARILVSTAGSTVGSVSDCATTGAVAAANLVFAIPAAVGSYDLDWPMALGIVITPGTGQVLSVSYN